MSKALLSQLMAGVVVSVFLVSQASAANKFYIEDVSVPVEATGLEIPVLADVDQDTYAFSVSIQFDASKINVTDVKLGSDAAALTPEYNEGQLSNSPGTIIHGVVFDMSDPVSKKLTTGNGKELLILTVDILSADEDSVTLAFVNRSAETPARLNVMTDENARSVLPPPEIEDGTVSIVNEKPVIDSFLFNTGIVGKKFIVVGRNFDVTGLEVRVCGVVAGAELKGAGGQQLEVTAPSCSTPLEEEWAEVEVCTDLGCVSVAEGFYYEAGVAPTLFVRGNANDDAVVDLSDGVAILNDLFLGLPAPAPCRDSLDANDDGKLDVSDGIYLLNFLFLGGDDISPPYPVAGVDPTSDSLPGC